MCPRRLTLILPALAALTLLATACGGSTANHAPHVTYPTPTSAPHNTIPATPPPSGSSTTTLPAAPAAPLVPPSAVAVITKYVAAREDSIGADQTSPTSWQTIVKPLMTAAGLASSAQYGPLSGGGAYALAHQNNWVIKTTLSDCVWASAGNEPTGSVTTTTLPLNLTSGEVTCTLTDTVVNSANGTSVATSSIPYGWTASGPQGPVAVSLVTLNGAWLIDSDTSALPA